MTASHEPAATASAVRRPAGTARRQMAILARPIARMCRLSKPTLAAHCAPAANDNRTSIPDIEL